ncbi:MAG: DNA topoisomerase IV subunit A [Bacilli bacterium]|nr:DNA topoisomerase IV subunit A [Bacilli bacterium]
MNDVLKRIYDYSLEDIMGERFGRYAKTIIQDRAIPDVRDGLKPVQRRILYAMYKSKNTFDHAYKKSGETVGEVMGKYHPHGDSSIYEAMVRMSQWWKQNACFVDMHGNNGSMDGDGPAAYRYTEARLSKIANEMLKDLEKETVNWAPNYADTLMEPTVLPSKYPNLLVNGTTGISAGYATNIPPHNLGEIIDATIMLIDNPKCDLDTIIGIVKGPDFPTGGIVEGINGIREAYETGRGRIIVKSKVNIEKSKKMTQLIVSEIPFDVNKALIVKKIDEIRIDKKIDGILEVRDESDREDPVRIVIDLKPDSNHELILNYLLKNTDLQISYNFNMVSIVHNRPMTLGIIPILEAYIEFQKEVVTKRTEFDLKHAQARMHIVEGLIKAISILDAVIKTIRASKNKSDAINNLIKEFAFTELQADAIVTLQLYRLTNTDVTELEEEMTRLAKIIKGLTAILSDSQKLNAVIKEELKRIKTEHGIERKTEIREEITEIKIDTTDMIAKEDVVVLVTKEGYVKRASKRSYASTDGEPSLKDGDYVLGMYELNTMDVVLLFTDKGNYLYVPVYEIPDLKWKDLGKHISNIIKINEGENIVSAIPVTNFDKKEYLTFFSRDGMIKRCLLSDFKVSRYNKPMTCMKLKDEDRLITVTNKKGMDIFLTTHLGYGLRYSIDEVPIIGVRGSGVKAINLTNDFVVGGNIINDEDYIVIITNKSTGKRIKVSEVEKTSRARKGSLIIRNVKTNPYYIINSYVVHSRSNLGLKFKEDIEIIKLTDLPIVDKNSTGTSLSKMHIIDCFIVQELTNINNNETIKEEKQEVITPEQISLDIIDDTITKVDNILDNIDI